MARCASNRRHRAFGAGVRLCTCEIGVGVAFLRGQLRPTARTIAFIVLVGKVPDLSSITQGDQQMEAAASEKLDLLKSKRMLCLCGRSPTKPTSSWPTRRGYSTSPTGHRPLDVRPVDAEVDFDYKLDEALR